MEVEVRFFEFKDGLLFREDRVIYGCVCVLMMDNEYV
jgi:hypothetical protein